jgi:hypothetical protein
MTGTSSEGMKSGPTSALDAVILLIMAAPDRTVRAAGVVDDAGYFLITQLHFKCWIFRHGLEGNYKLAEGESPSSVPDGENERLNDKAPLRLAIHPLGTANIEDWLELTGEPSREICS